MLTFEELRCAAVMMKRAPLKGDESLTVAQTILKIEAMARKLAAKPTEEASTDDDSRPAE